MEHAIDVVTGIQTVRPLPWARLGTELDNLQTANEAIISAGLDFEVMKTQALYRNPVGGKIIPIPDGYVTCRKDTGATFAQVGKHYSILQNKDAFLFMDEITSDPNGPKYVHAGMLNGGARVFMVAKLPDFIKVTDSDVIGQYLLLSNSHDGSSSVNIALIAARFVCGNAIPRILRTLKGSGKRFSARHTPGVIGKVNTVQDVLGISAESSLAITDMVAAMKSHEPTPEEIDQVLRGLFAPSMDDGDELTTQAINAMEGCKRLAFEGDANKLAGDTKSAYALYNGITEYVQNERNPRVHPGGDYESARFNTNFFGAGANLSTRALEDVLALV